MSAIYNGPWPIRIKADRKPRKAKPPSLPEWILQAAMIAEWNKCEAEGMALSAVGDMNAAKRSYQTAMQCKAMGLKPGEPDVRLYGYPARVLFVEVKRKGEKPSPKQVERHDLLAELGHTVLVVAPTDQDDARRIARAIANQFCDRRRVL